MKKWKNVIWDWNGTLLNDVNECIQIINQSLKKRGLQILDKKKYLEKFQFPVKKYYEAIGFDFSKESFEEAGQEYIDAYSQKMFFCSLQPGVEKTLRLFEKAGVRQFVLSALNADALRECVNKYSLSSFFQQVRGLQDYYAHSKVELGKELMNQEKLDPGETALIGDTLHDYEVAGELGVDCILVACGHNSLKRLETTTATIFENLPKLTQKLYEIY
jgi:phosphoglycolate phosphatase